MSKLGFVILHYLTDQLTVRCIESIRQTNTLSDYEVVVVDNGSENGSGELLRQQFAGQGLHFILLPKNLGFTAGCNAGYRYAKTQLDCDFIAFVNNDLCFTSDNILSVLEKDVGLYHAAVIGPKIVDLKKESADINPKKAGSYHPHKEMRKLHRKLTDMTVGIVLSFFDMDLLFFTAKNKLGQLIPPPQPHPGGDKPLSGVELHGSCLFFTPLYTGRFDGLQQVTFMYHEELLLRDAMEQAGLGMLYEPAIHTVHYGGCASAAVAKRPAKARRIRYIREKQSARQTLQYLSAAKEKR